mmetsp:Transcript_5680/g.9578  ORF Transcript_5680/g.9578 Transcript_5680/m.9578 type:complete len:120 (+) Transcript_5680:149-508(+)
MQRADTVDSVLKVQRELTSVTSQLEAKQAVAQRLSRTASTSTLRVALRQARPLRPPPPRPVGPLPWSLSRSVERAQRWLWRVCTKLVDVSVFGVFAAVPLALAAAFLYGACRLFLGLRK